MACWMRHLQRCAVSTGKRGSTMRSGLHNVPGQPFPVLEHHFPGTAFLTFKENFLRFDCAHCPLWALLRRAWPLCTPRCSQPCPKTPPASGAPCLLKESSWEGGWRGKTEGVLSPLQPSGGWAAPGVMKHKIPLHSSLITVIIHCCYVQNIISTQASSSFCATPHPLTPHHSRLPIPPSPRCSPQDWGRIPFSQSMG